MRERDAPINTEVVFEAFQTESAGLPVLTVRGEVDVATAPRLRESLTGLVESGARTIVVDLSEVSFVDSTALGVLVTAVQQLRAEGGDLRLVVIDPHISKVLQITGLTDVFAIYATSAEATKG